MEDSLLGADVVGGFDPGNDGVEMSHELIVLNAGYCGGCIACGNREETFGCSCGAVFDYPDDPDEQFADHLEDVDDEPATETEWLGRKGDDPWAALE